MQGLELCEKYYQAFGAPMIRDKFPEYAGRIAAGLVGDGSECFGFDDVLSQDHDWGPSFCLWLDHEDYQSIGAALQKEYLALPQDFTGFAAREISQWGSGRVGVFETGTFYRHFIGLDHPPKTNQEWRWIPEVNLAAATNGKVFFDPTGEFTGFREVLLAFYPEDIRLKKIAARCMKIGQSGQYNFERCLRRNEYIAANHALAEFIEAAISLVFLLNKRYRPFYKWMHRALKDLPILGKIVHTLLSELILLDVFSHQPHMIERIETICDYLAEELKIQQLSHSESDFLLDHGVIVQQKIRDDAIRAIPPMAE